MPTKHLVRFFILALRCLVIFSDFPTRVVFCAYIFTVRCAGSFFAYNFFFRNCGLEKCAAIVRCAKQSLAMGNLTFLLTYVRILILMGQCLMAMIWLLLASDMANNGDFFLQISNNDMRFHNMYAYTCLYVYNHIYLFNT